MTHLHMRFQISTPAAESDPAHTQECIDMEDSRNEFAQSLGGWETHLTGSCTVRHLVTAIEGELLRRKQDALGANATLLAWQNLTNAVKGSKT